MRGDYNPSTFVLQGKSETNRAPLAHPVEARQTCPALLQRFSEVLISELFVAGRFTVLHPVHLLPQFRHL